MTDVGDTLIGAFELSSKGGLARQALRRAMWYLPRVLSLAVSVTLATHMLPMAADLRTAGIELQAATSIDLACADHDWQHGECRALLPLRLTNRTGAEVEVLRAWAEGPEHLSKELGVTLSDGATWEGELELRREGRHQVRFDVRYRARTTMGSPSVTVAVRCPDRDQARAACRTCRGRWGKHGILQREGCVCRAGDGGKPCDDGDKCQGVCVFKRMVVRKGRRQCAADGACTRELDLVRAAGTCSQWLGDFGCVTTIPNGASRVPQSSAPELSRICAD